MKDEQKKHLTSSFILHPSSFRTGEIRSASCCFLPVGIQSPTEWIRPQASPANTNLFYTGSPGRIWNPASGLGTPDFAALARAFSRA